MRQKYKYIEVVKDLRVSEGKALKYIAATIIDTDSDSAAYCKAFQNKRSAIEVEKEFGKATIIPVDFILYNNLEEDIKSKVFFVGKQQREKEIMEMISSLEIPKK